MSDCDQTQSYNKTQTKVGCIGGGSHPVVNPRDLTNEELEYVIKTGCLPTRFAPVPQSSASSSEQRQEKTHQF